MIWFYFVLDRILQRSRTNRMCFYPGRDLFWGAGSGDCGDLGRPGSDLIGEASRLETQESPTWNPKTVCWEARKIWCWRWGLRTIFWRIPPAQLTLVFGSIQVFNCLDAAHPHDGGQTASKSTDSNIKFFFLLQKYSCRNIQNNVWLNIWVPWSS